MYASLRPDRQKADKPAEGLQVSVSSTNGAQQPTDAQLPVTVDEAKGFCRVDHAADDLLFLTLIRAATEQAERYTRRAIAPQTLVAEWARANAYARLPRPPHRAITLVERITDEGAAQALQAGTDYRTRGLDQLTVHPNMRYSMVGPIADGLRVTFEAGYADADGNPDAPEAIRLAILRSVKHHYDHRDDEVVGTVVGRLTSGAKSLLRPYRYFG